MRALFFCPAFRFTTLLSYPSEDTTSRVSPLSFWRLKGVERGGARRRVHTRDTEPLTSDDLCDRRAFLGVGACLPDGDELAAVLGRLAGIGDPLVLYGFDV